jgi:hypothetical protein
MVLDSYYNSFCDMEMDWKQSGGDTDISDTRRTESARLRFMGLQRVEEISLDPDWTRLRIRVSEAGARFPILTGSRPRFRSITLTAGSRILET